LSRAQPAASRLAQSSAFASHFARKTRFRFDVLSTT
jgi:hypothetical protein